MAFNASSRLKFLAENQNWQLTILLRQLTNLVSVLLRCSTPNRILEGEAFKNL